MQMLSSPCPWHVSSTASTAWLGLGAVALREFGISPFGLLSAALIQVFFGARKDEILYKHSLKAASVEVFCKAVPGKCPAEFCRLKTGRHSKHLEI